MKRQPLLAKAALRLQISNEKSAPVPTGGWNARDSLLDMKANDAITMTNMFPSSTSIDVRGGSIDHATGMTGNGKTLATYSGLSGSTDLFCATSSGIYNVSSAGAVGAAVIARTNGKHQHCMFGDGTSSWLIMCNGVDKPAYYNGAAWTAVDGASTPALTGVTTTTLVSPMVYQGRLWFAQVDTLNVWYLASGAVGGALTKFDLSLVASRGGYIMAMINWTYDGGDGSDDRAVFVTSEGEVIVYQGINPSSAATWEKVGTYYVGKPLGRRCLCKYGGDVLLLTEEGVIPLSSALTGVVNDSKFALSNKIETAFRDRAKLYGGVFGWEIIFYPKESALIVNCPASEDGANHLQFVMNTTTQAWCWFSDWEAECFGILSKQLYFTVGTKTVKAWTSDRFDYSSSTDYVIGSCMPSYRNIGQAGGKKVKMLRLLAQNPHASTFSGLTNDAILYTFSNLSAPTPVPWNEPTRDGIDRYLLNEGLNKQWLSPPTEPGKYFTFAINFYGVTLLQWVGTDYVYEDGFGL